MMDSGRSKEVAHSLLEAVSGEQVDKILGAHPEFADPGNWRPYGDAPRNWDRVGMQNSEPSGAFTELIINSVDAILLRKVREAGIDPAGADAPKSMQEAVKRFFPDILEGNLANLSATQRRELASKSIIVAIKRARRRSRHPTYTIVDHGEGQNPARFPHTLLSLAEDNKARVPFVQGQFNMGSTGSIAFCTRGRIKRGQYKLILSKRALDDSDGHWGWTLIRVQEHEQSGALPTAVYFAPGPDRSVPSFAAQDIAAFPDIGDGSHLLKAGTVVKLYEYDMGDSIGHVVEQGLHDALAMNLMGIALPVRTLDFDVAPRPGGGLGSKGIGSRVFAGLRVILTRKPSDTEPSEDGEEEGGNLELEHLVMEEGHPELGDVKVRAYGVREMQKFLRGQTSRVFFTMNGQAHAKEGGVFLGRAKRGDLSDNLVVEVVCDGLKGDARVEIFQPDRRTRSEKELTATLDRLVINALEKDSALNEYAEKVQRRRAEDAGGKSDQSLLKKMVKSDPGLLTLFREGDDIPVRPRGRRSKPDTDWEGKEFPTFLTPKKKGEVGIPLGGSRQITCETDASNDYLVRSRTSGRLLRPTAEVLPNRASLRNGRLTLVMQPWDGASVGEAREVQFGFVDSSREHNPLTFKLAVKIAPKGKAKTRSRPRTASPKLEFPDIQWVRKEKWPGFDDESGAEVREGGKITVYVNRDNKHLLDLLQREKDEKRRGALEEAFRYSVGLSTLAMYRRLHKGEGSASEEAEKVLRDASAAIAEHMVLLVRQLGRNL